MERGPRPPFSWIDFDTLRFDAPNGKANRRHISDSGISAIQAYRRFRHIGDSGISAIQAYRRCRHIGDAGISAMQAHSLSSPIFIAI
jgi:hypothetical protein